MKNAFMRRSIAALVFLAAPCAAFADEAAPNAQLNALFERLFKQNLEEHPEFATFLGVDGYDDRLTDRSPAAIARRKARLKETIAELRRFDPAQLSTQDRISRDVMLENLLLKEQMNALYADLPFSEEDGWMQISPMHGPQEFLAAVARATAMRRERDYENYVKRLAAIPRSLEEQTAIMRTGVKTGWMPPRAAMERVPGMLAVYAGDATYLPACRKELGASSLPAGPQYYALQVRDKTTTTLTPAQIHELGKREVARIRTAMDEVIVSTGFKGSFAEFVHFLKTDPRFFFKTPEARLVAYRDIAKRADAELPKLFAELPRLPYGIRAMEAFEGDNADHYSPGALDGSRAGFFEANVNNIGKRSSPEMESTLLHEAVPGHHLQISRALELKGLPLFRRSSWYVAYGEGWALYAESLGYEMGFYKDPYMRFGALSNEILRACRLVVDTGLHSMGWTREQAIRYMVDNATEEGFAAAEVDRYIVWPGQALGYKIGELKIKALRAKARAALGDKFDLRRFHNVLLDDGALPLTVLEARVDEWIAGETTK